MGPPRGARAGGRTNFGSLISAGPARPLGGTRTASYRALARNRPFLWLSLAGAGSFAAPTASLVVLLYAITSTFLGSDHPVELAALALALLGLSSTIPTLATAVFAGTVADRADRRALLRWVNAAAILATLAIVVLFVFRPTTPVAVPGSTEFVFPEWIVLLYPLWAVETTAVTLFRPAFNASLPLLVAKSELGRANGMVYATALGFSIVASLGAGALTNGVSPEAALLVPVALFALAQLALFGVRGEISAPPSAAPEPFLKDAAAGYRYLWDHRALLGITLGALAINFFSAVAFVELGLYVVDWLGVNQAILIGAMIAGGSLGAAAGTLLVNRFHFEARAGRFLVILVALQGSTVVVLGLVRTVWIALPDMFLFGLFPGMFTTVFLATLQATVPNQLLGRVLAADEVGSFAMIPVGQYVGGTVTAIYGIPSAYLVAGAGTVLVGAAMAAYGGIRRIGFTPSEDGADAEPPPRPPAPAPEFELASDP